MTVRISKLADSGSVGHNVQAQSGKVVSLARMERPSRFVHLLPEFVLLFGRKGAQYGRGSRRRLDEKASVSVIISDDYS
jgi:hypothetical protein